MKTKYSKDTRLILDSQERVLKNYDAMIQEKQAEMLERIKHEKAEKKASEFAKKTK